jgi:hypothetical protein
VRWIVRSWNGPIGARPLKFATAPSHIGSIDVLGATMLAARLRAGVRIGQVIEVLGDSPQDERLRREEVGLVRGFEDDGLLVVQWSAGLVAEIDPSLEAYEQLSPSAPKYALV